MGGVNVLVVLLVCCSGRGVGGDDFRVGVLTTGEMGLPFQMYSSAINIAVDDFMKEGWLQGHTIRLFYRNDLCDPKVGAGLAVEMTMEENATALLGSYCSNVSISVGYFIAWSNTALLSHSSTDPELRDKNTFSTIIRVKPSFGKLGDAVIALFRHNQWSRVVMIITKNGYCESGGEAIQGAIQGVGREITLSDYIRANEDFSSVETEDYLDRINARSRVVLMCGGTGDKHRLLVRAHERGMVAPEYTYIFFDMLPNDHDNTYQPWTQLPIDKPDTMALSKMYMTVKQLTMSEITGESIDRFYDSIPVKLQDQPWQSDKALDGGWENNKDALFLHDLTKLWLLVLNETLAEGGDPRNGTTIFQKSRNRRFSGLTGDVMMDDLADRDPEFWLWTLNPGDTKFHPGIKITMSKPEDERVEVSGTIFWGTEDGLAPPAVPLCGFFNEFCPQDTTVRNAGIIGGSVGGLLVIISIVVWVLVYKRKQLEQELSAMLWKVRFEDVQLTKQRAGSVIGLSMKSMKSIRSRGSAISDRAETVQKNSDQMFAEMGLFKGNMVAVKRVSVPEVIPDRQDLLDFKAMRELSHDNINPFVGAVVDAPDHCYLMAYCPKGSLQDIIEQDEIGLDWMFKSSLISDLVNGLSYLHKSNLNSHGSLKSTNCLVDGRWTLKISGYGLYIFKSRESTADKGEYELYRGMLWTAPELLRAVLKPRYGTQKGDIYGVAIIMQELVFRNMPFFLDTMTPKECVTRVRAGETVPYRPVMPSVEDDTNPEIVKLIEECWEENPADRPDPETIKKRLRVINKGKKINILDQMVGKMEAYTNNLEEIVASRTGELTEEKKKTDRLLYRMLPESVAEALKQGKSVDPEMYEMVSIYFSDIVGFTSISAASTPMQVVDLLNDLYTLFDDILDRYDVYKVETIGDAYMVASGLPKRNGDKHVTEIASMSIDLLHAVSDKFRIRHRPDMRMKLRSGFHSGPVAAGVVGLTMPRYCLFGETVNIASLMESSGEALRVQCSQASSTLLGRLSGFSTSLREGYEDKGSDTRYWLNKL